MREDTDHPAEPTDEPADGADWIDHQPSETVRAVEPNDTTAGLDVTLIDLPDPEPPMVELHQHFPPEDDQEGDSVYIHGEHAALQTITALAELVATRHDAYPWPDQEDADE